MGRRKEKALFPFQEIAGRSRRREEKEGRMKWIPRCKREKKGEKDRGGIMSSNAFPGKGGRPKR